MKASLIIGSIVLAASVNVASAGIYHNEGAEGVVDGVTEVVGGMEATDGHLPTTVGGGGRGKKQGGKQGEGRMNGRGKGHGKGAGRVKGKGNHQGPGGRGSMGSSKASKYSSSGDEPPSMEIHECAFANPAVEQANILKTANLGGDYEDLIKHATMVNGDFYECVSKWSAEEIDAQAVFDKAYGVGQAHMSYFDSLDDDELVLTLACAVSGLLVGQMEDTCYYEEWEPSYESVASIMQDGFVVGIGFDIEDCEGMYDTPYPVCPANPDSEYCDGAGDCDTAFCTTCSAGQAFCDTGVNPCVDNNDPTGFTCYVDRG